MQARKKEEHLSEYGVKLLLGDWLEAARFEIFDEKENKDRRKWGTFKVTNIDRGKRPDLVACGNLKAAQKPKRNAYVAIEIKRGYKHHDILDGFDAILEYFSDYLWGAEYWIEGKPIKIAAFVFATRFSEKGYLFQEEEKLPHHNIVMGAFGESYPMTFTISRLLWRQKDNLVKRFHTLAGIPKAEQRLKGMISTGRTIPEIGVLVLNPTNKDEVRLMLSEHPYHWRFEATQ